MSVDIEPLPVTGRVEHGALFSGSNTLYAVLQNTTSAPIRGSLLINGTYSSGEMAFEKKIPVSIAAKKSLKLPVDVTFAVPGSVNIAGSAVLEKSTVFISSITAAVQPPFDINDPHPMVFQGEKWGVYLRVFTAGKRDITLKIRQNGKTVSQSTEKGIQGKRFISLPTGDLAPGEYTLSIISGKDSISVPLRIIPRI